MRRLKTIELVVLVFATAVITGALLLPWILKAKVEAEIAKIESAGDPIRTADLAEIIPDEENAAVVYARAFEIISESPAKDEIDSAADVLHPDRREENPALWDEAS